jgi:hypothetical protein
VELSRRDVPDLARSAGGVLVAVGAVALLARKSSHHGWSHFELLLVVLIPTVVLYAMALGGSGREADGLDGEPQPWQTVLLVLAVLLGPVALLEFLVWVGANTARHVLYEAAVFALTSVIAAYAARRIRVSYAALLAGLALLVTWLLVWESILDHPSTGTYRWLLVAAAVLLLALAYALGRRGAIGAGEIATAGGVAAVVAGVIGVIVGLLSAVLGGVASVLESSRTSTITSGRRFSSLSSTLPARVPRHLVEVHRHARAIPFRHLAQPGRIQPNPLAGVSSGLHSGLQHFGWDLYLLVISAALLWIGARVRVRGLGYVGGFGLLAFVLSVGDQVTRIEGGLTATHALAGWPLALLILGVAGLAAPTLKRGRSPSP